MPCVKYTEFEKGGTVPNVPNSRNMLYVKLTLFGSERSAILTITYAAALGIHQNRTRYSQPLRINGNLEQA